MSREFKDSKHSNKSDHTQNYNGFDIGRADEQIQIKRHDGTKINPVHRFLDKLQLSWAESKSHNKLECKPSHAHDIRDVEDLILSG